MSLHGDKETEKARNANKKSRATCMLNFTFSLSYLGKEERMHVGMRKISD